MDSFNKENIIISQDDISTPIPRLKTDNNNNTSPLKDKKQSRSFMDNTNNTSRFLNLNKKESFILPDDDDDEARGEDLFNVKSHHQDLERQIANLMVTNNSLVQENQNLEMELLLKEKDILLKSSKINELVISNRQLEKNLQIEMNNNELNYSNWSTLKQNYENKISNLNNRISNFQNKTSNDNNVQDMNDNEITIQILNKKLKSLKSDYELEKNSKMLIIDEFEIIKQNYLNLELNYNLLKNEYDKLQEENAGSIITSEEIELENKLQDISFQTDSSYGDDDVEHIYSSEREEEEESPITLADEFEQEHLRQQQQDKYHYNQELIKLNFQIKSLNLQNEKLYSYIGYLLQNTMINGNNSKEYSDEKLIKIAKKKLVNNKILRSVSSSLRLHQSNRTDQQQPLTVYLDHATDEEMSIFLNDPVYQEQKKIYNIKSTANLKKLHITTSHSTRSSSSSSTIREEDEEVHEKIKLSILNDLIIGNKMVLQKLDLKKLIFSGVVEFNNNNESINDDNNESEYNVD